MSEAIELPYVDGFVFSNVKNEDKKRNRRRMLGLKGRRGRIPSLRTFMFKINR